MLTLNNRRGQIWSFDLIFALIIFIVGLVVIYFYAINYNSTTSSSLAGLYYDADLATNIILGSDAFSLVDGNGKLNQTRLDEFAALTDGEIRTYYSVSNNFYLYIPGLVISGVSQEKIGIINTSQTDNQILISRIVLYNDRPTKMEVIAWD